MSKICWLCPTAFDNMTQLRRHIISSAHRRQTVLCPWCTMYERTFTRLTDLFDHCQQRHFVTTHKLPKSLFGVAAGFYFSIYPEDYARIISPAAWDSDDAMEARRHILRWASKQTDSVTKTANWRRGWKAGLKVAEDRDAKARARKNEGPKEEKQEESRGNNSNKKDLKKGMKKQMEDEEGVGRSKGGKTKAAKEKETKKQDDGTVVGQNEQENKKMKKETEQESLQKKDRNNNDEIELGAMDDDFGFGELDEIDLDYEDDDEELEKAVRTLTGDIDDTGILGVICNGDKRKVERKSEGGSADSSESCKVKGDGKRKRVEDNIKDAGVTDGGDTRKVRRIGEDGCVGMVEYEAGGSSEKEIGGDDMDEGVGTGFMDGKGDNVDEGDVVGRKGDGQIKKVDEGRCGKRVACKEVENKEEDDTRKCEEAKMVDEGDVKDGNDVGRIGRISRNGIGDKMEQQEAGKSYEDNGKMEEEDDIVEDDSDRKGISIGEKIQDSGCGDREGHKEEDVRMKSSDADVVEGNMEMAKGTDDEKKDIGRKVGDDVNEAKDASMMRIGRKGDGGKRRVKKGVTFGEGVKVAKREIKLIQDEDKRWKRVLVEEEIGKDKLCTDDVKDDVTDTESSSSDEEDNEAKSERWTDKGYQKRARDILITGLMPHCPPARRRWGSISMEINCGGMRLTWPPTGWMEMSADRKLLAWEYAAMRLEEVTQGNVSPGMSRCFLLDKYNFLALPGTAKYRKEDHEKAASRVRFYTYQMLRGISIGKLITEAEIAQMEMLETLRRMGKDSLGPILRSIKSVPLRLEAD